MSNVTLHKGWLAKTVHYEEKLIILYNKALENDVTKN